MNRNYRSSSTAHPCRKLEHAGKKERYETAPMFGPPSNTRQGRLIQIVCYEKQMDFTSKRCSMTNGKTVLHARENIVSKDSIGVVV